MSVSRNPSLSRFNSAAASRVELNSEVPKIDRMVSPTPPIDFHTRQRINPNRLQPAHRAPSEYCPAFEHRRICHTHDSTNYKLEQGEYFDDDDDGDEWLGGEEFRREGRDPDRNHREETAGQPRMPRKFGSLGRHDDGLIRSYLQRNSSGLYKSQTSFAPRFGSMRIRSETGRQSIFLPSCNSTSIHFD